jgi:hypothetical protein
MSRKDFELVASIIRQLHRENGDNIPYDRLVKDFADSFAGTNPRFDEERFVAACE